MKFWKHQPREHIWHVFDRGVRQSPIFFTDEQRRLFLRLLKWALERCSMQVLTFCLMDNHYHLLLKGTGEALSRCMLLLKSRYARELNQQMETSGRLFQSEYRSYRAKSEAWVVDRATYIHLNPVAAGIVDDPEKYRWSSLGAFLGRKSELDILNPKPVLKVAGGRERYRDIVGSTATVCRDFEREARMAYETQSGSEGRSREEVSILMEESRGLHRVISEEMNHPRNSWSHRVAKIRMLTAYLAGIWEVGTVLTTAAVLVCDRSTVYRHRRRGAMLIEEDRSLRRLVSCIRRRYLGKVAA